MSIIRGRVAVSAIVVAVSTVGHTAVSVDGYRDLAYSEAVATIPYRDQAGVLTVCYGETKNVEMREYSLEECSEKLVRRVEGYFEPQVAKCTKGWSKLSQKTRDSIVEFAYNIGVGGYCGSSVRKRLDAGYGIRACDRMGLWNKIRVGGRLVRNQGLANRRAREMTKCREGFKEQGGENVA